MGKDKDQDENLQNTDRMLKEVESLAYPRLDSVSPTKKFDANATLDPIENVQKKESILTDALAVQIEGEFADGKLK